MIFFPTLFLFLPGHLLIYLLFSANIPCNNNSLLGHKKTKILFSFRKCCIYSFFLSLFLELRYQGVLASNQNEKQINSIILLFFFIIIMTYRSSPSSFMGLSHLRQIFIFSQIKKETIRFKLNYKSPDARAEGKNFCP